MFITLFHKHCLYPIDCLNHIKYFNWGEGYNNHRMYEKRSFSIFMVFTSLLFLQRVGDSWFLGSRQCQFLKQLFIKGTVSITSSAILNFRKAGNSLELATHLYKSSRKCRTKSIQFLARSYQTA